MEDECWILATKQPGQTRIRPGDGQTNDVSEEKKVAEQDRIWKQGLKIACILTKEQFHSDGS
jgi:hypothetical protein